MIYLTGDTHRDFDRVFHFCERMGTTKEDILIILGDAGINYFLDGHDLSLKQELSRLPITLFCVHGNHEERPENISSYEEQEWHDGIVFCEPEFPNLLFARDGEIYTLDGRRVLVIGGAYSVDKYYRLRNGLQWFENEQPDEFTKKRVEERLAREGWQVDDVLTHTAPLSYEPTWAFLPSIDQSRVDKSTEEWLDTIEKRLTYENWYLGHYHVSDQQDNVHILFSDYLVLGE